MTETRNFDGQAAQIEALDRAVSQRLQRMLEQLASEPPLDLASALSRATGSASGSPPATATALATSGPMQVELSTEAMELLRRIADNTANLGTVAQ